jgi:hypothetical protein
MRGLQRDPEQRWPAMRPLLDALAPFARAPARSGWLAVAAASTLLLGGGLGLATLATGDDACSAGSERIAAVWNPELRASIAATAAQSGLARATATWARAEEIFAGYADAWTRGHADACEASGAQLDLRMACLDERRAAFATALGMFRRLDAEVLAHSEELLGDLPKIEACADDSYLRAKVRPPDDPAVAARVTALRSDLAGVEMLETGGKFSEALTALAPLEAAAPASYLPPARRARPARGHHPREPGPLRRRPRRPRVRVLPRHRGRPPRGCDRRRHPPRLHRRPAPRRRQRGQRLAAPRRDPRRPPRRSAAWRPRPHDPRRPRQQRPGHEPEPRAARRGQHRLR